MHWLEFYINGLNTLCTHFCLLLSLSIVLLRVLHIMYINVLFFFIAELYHILCLHRELFIHYLFIDIWDLSMIELLQEKAVKNTGHILSFLLSKNLFAEWLTI